MNVMFLKDFPVGFIYNYQLGVKKKKFCHYYNIEKRICKIYEKRPAICKYYPLNFSYNNFRIPRVNDNCTVIKRHLKKKIPTLKEGQKFEQRIEYNDLISAFPIEYEIFLKTRFEWFIKVSYITKLFDYLIIPPNKVYPGLIKSYTLIDMSKFFNWAKENLKKPKDLSILRVMKENYNKITNMILNKIKD